MRAHLPERSRWVSPEDRCRMSGIQTKSQNAFLEYSHAIGLSTMQGRGFYYPADSAIGNDGRIYVVSRSLEGDNRGVRITVCDLDSEYFGTIGSFGESPGQFIWPTGIAVDSQGLIYVSDEYTHRITVFDSSGGLQEVWGAQGDGNGELNGPSGLAFDSQGDLYVVDHLNNRVQKFTRDGRFMLTFGSEGAEAGQFNLPLECDRLPQR